MILYIDKTYLDSLKLPYSKEVIKITEFHVGYIRILTHITFDYNEDVDFTKFMRFQYKGMDQYNPSDFYDLEYHENLESINVSFSEKYKNPIITFKLKGTIKVLIDLIGDGLLLIKTNEKQHKNCLRN
ncbi:MAG: hypothetical protein HY934_04160 [Candidatus Firestonebacteria bacterium]|nr:hypothetical protein [Candidatus Firestonebacteria bacterium]